MLLKNSAQTKKFAAALARKILRGRPHRKYAAVIGLIGDLGAGKTTFTQGFARGLGLRRRITSPTFLMVRRYTLHATRYTNFYHIDCYRIRSPRELITIGIKKILRDPENIVLIEWADKIKKLLPRDTLRIHFVHGASPHERHLNIEVAPLDRFR